MQINSLGRGVSAVGLLLATSGSAERPPEIPPLPGPLLMTIQGQAETFDPAVLPLPRFSDELPDLFLEPPLTAINQLLDDPTPLLLDYDFASGEGVSVLDASP